MELVRKARGVTRKVVFGGNAYNVHELAGAFGDLGTLIPFVVGYIVISQFGLSSFSFLTLKINLLSNRTDIIASSLGFTITP